MGNFSDKFLDCLQGASKEYGRTGITVREVLLSEKVLDTVEIDQIFNAVTMTTLGIPGKK